MTANKFARIVSNIFIPPFFFLVCVIVLSLQSNSELAAKIYIILISIIIGVVLPIGYVLQSVKNKVISNIDAEKKEERNKPYLLGIILFFSGFLLLKTLGLNESLQMFYLVFVVNLALTLIINYFWKISAHSQGAAISLGVMWFWDSNIFFLLLPLVLLVMWSRFELKVHSIPQIIAGGILGFSATYFSALYLSEHFSVR